MKANGTRKEVLVTGVSGFIGGALARYLLQQGYGVAGTTRSGVEDPGLTGLAVHKFDLLHPETGGLELEKIDVIVHCAAFTSERPVGLAVARQANVVGTKVLLEAARASGVRRFVYLSSMSAHSGNPSVYARLKLETEGLVASMPGIEWAIARPGLVIGMSARGMFHKMRSIMGERKLVPTIAGPNALSTVYIDDLCEVLERTMGAPDANHRAFDVCAEERLEFSDIVQAIAHGQGRRVVTIPLPKLVALVIAHSTGWLRNPPVTADNVYGISEARSGDTQFVREILGMRLRALDDSVHLSMLAQEVAIR